MLLNNARILKNPTHSVSEWIKTDGWRNLPGWIRNPVLFIVKKCTCDFVVDKELLKYLVEFYNHDQGYSELALNSDKDGVMMLKTSFRFVNDLWRLRKPSNEEEFQEFYRIVPWYIFDIAHTHMFRHDRRFKKRVTEQCEGKVLDFGGGIGDLSAKLAERGHDVTYFDIESKCMEFAKWYFAKKGLNIKVLVAGKKLELPETYDTIICVEVIEHLTNPEESLVIMVSHLKKKGRLIITQLDCEGKTESNPMHLKINFDAKRLLNSQGLHRSKHYPWLWTKE